ncbi:MAG: F0F1 ATP synthase subunit B [Edaphobacter sp.]
MLIDWFTVGAQALNFLILVWLLQRYLYKPILTAIDAREKRITDRLADATKKQTDAQKEHDEFDAKNRAIDEQRNTLFTKATDDAKAEHDRLLDEVKKEADTARAQRADTLKNDNARLSKEIARTAADEVFEIARKTLNDLSTVSLEERIAEVFTRRLREMDDPAKATMGRAIRASSDPAIVRSTFAQPDDQKASIQKAVNETFATAVRIRFETTPDGVCGIELTAGGQKIAWTITNYLDSLDAKFGELLSTQPEAK